MHFLFPFAFLKYATPLLFYFLQMLSKEQSSDILRPIVSSGAA